LSDIHTTQFKQDLNRIKKRGYDTSKLRWVIIKLHDRKKLHKKHKDHKLRGKMRGSRECRIDPDNNDDWLLIYHYENLDLILERTGSHSDLFN
jgi:mRNA interferase YafQ